MVNIDETYMPTRLGGFVGVLIVDTFNKGGVTATNSLQSPSVPRSQSFRQCKIYLFQHPWPLLIREQTLLNATGEIIQEVANRGKPSTKLQMNRHFRLCHHQHHPFNDFQA